MTRIILSADVTMYADSIGSLFQKLFELTNIWPTHSQTLASLALRSMLFNARLPNGRKLFLPYLDSSTYQLIAGTTNQITKDKQTDGRTDRRTNLEKKQGRIHVNISCIRVPRGFNAV